MELSNVVKELVAVFAEPSPAGRSGVGLSVSRAVSMLAVLYEKARNAVEFRAEHLVRRAAIERILKRRVMLSGSAGSVASNLITELLWARYVDSSIVDESKEAEIAIIIDKYLTVKQAISAGHSSLRWDVALGIMSAEIDEALVSAKKRQALVYLFYQAIRHKVTIPGVDELHTNLISFAATEQAYMQSDNALTSYHLLNLIDGDWSENSKPLTPSGISQFTKHVTMIRTVLAHQSLPAVFRYLRKQVPPYLLLRDFFVEVGDKAQEYIDDKAKLEEKLTELAQNKYNETGKKVRRAVVRSFIYIFLTKMIFALALEAPYDYYILKHVAPIPLLINTLFPPIMLFLVAGLFSVPGADNTRRLIERIKKTIYHFDELIKEEDTFTMKQRVRRPVLTAGFSFVYLATFALTFGLINLALSALQFSVVSKIIFVFFVALVSFFAYRIRHSAKEYEVIDRQGVLEPVMDFFLMPVLQAGQFLSKEIAKINIFIFFFDFILEAPLKTIFDLAEEWIRFVRVKKDEIV